MKNREKFKNEIKSAFETGSTCAFVREFVKPKLLDPSPDDVFCGNYNCHGCSKLFAFWLDEEYTEPEVDWSKVPVDTLVRVRNRKENKWVMRYFKGIDEKSPSYKFQVWMDGKTSKTVGGFGMEKWEYCELVEDAARSAKVAAGNVR